MIVKCCYCDTVVGEKEPLENREVTSTACPPCYAVEMAKIERRDYARKGAGK
jgi:hypothetical protein